MSSIQHGACTLRDPIGIQHERGVATVSGVEQPSGDLVRDQAPPYDLYPQRHPVRVDKHGRALETRGGDPRLSHRICHHPGV
ncbi:MULTISPECIES: hypothetical protein [Arsenicicoccus]|uniref:hypothetical protein n=1 Tax=Arsenicicoccus TaxID=267408 RepID=UPI0025799069|nr:MULTISPECIES: hypothetical protein [Arsenicicoccus]